MNNQSDAETMHPDIPMIARISVHDPIVARSAVGLAGLPTIVAIGPFAELAAKYQATAIFFIVAPDRDELAELAELVDCGALQVTIAATFPLSDGRVAFARGTDKDRPPGKTVLVVRE